MAIAEMGYFGKVSFDGLPNASGDGVLARPDSSIRATSIDLNVQQSITKPPLIDNRLDYTTYQLGPKEVGGGIQFPAIHGALNGSSSAGIVGSVWNAAMQRSATNGRLSNEFSTFVRYVSGAAHPYGAGDPVSFKYTRCQVDSLELSVAQQGTLDVNMNLFGIDRQDGTEEEVVYPTRNTRIVTWNDVVAAFHVADPQSSTRSGMVTGQVLRNFSININNGLERFYTLNNRLFPEDITATKREITGSATALGRIFNIGRMARTNEQRCSEFSQVVFGFRAAGSGNYIVDQDGAGNQYANGSCSGSTETFADPNTGIVYNTCSYDCSGGFFVYLPGVVFEIETLGLSTDVFETEFNYHVLPGAQQASFDSNAGQLVDTGSVDPNTFRFTGTVPSQWFANLDSAPPESS